MNWRTPIAVAIDRQYAESVQLPSTPLGARAHAIDKLIDDAATDVDRELQQESDPIALQQYTARLALLLAWKGSLPP